jgi:hypothetical protein
MRSNRPAPANGDEQDAFASYHRVFTWKAGQRRRIRQRANRRDRRVTRATLRTGLEA